MIYDAEVKYEKYLRESISMGTIKYLSNKIGLICKVGLTKSGIGTCKSVNRVRKI